jgi:general nucleoside transport system permease protein
MAGAEAAAEQAGRFDTRAIALGVAVPVLAIGVALVLGLVVVLVAGADPVGAYSALLRGAVGTPGNLAATLLRSVPIVVTGIGVGLAFRAGAFNLGGEGQMIAGALTSAVVANATPGLPAPLAIPLAIAAGCAAGAAWAFVPALLQVRLEVPILITTLLLNYVMALLGSYLVAYPLRDLTGGAALAQTAMLPESAWLPNLVPGTRIHLGVLAIVVLPALVAWLLRRTVFGYELRMVGANRFFAEYGGVDAGRTIVVAMLASGAVCGLAGTLLVQGVNHRFTDGLITSAGFAWSGFIAAILTLANPVLTVLAGLFLGALQVGAAGMARSTVVPLQLVDVIQATIIIVVAVRPAIRGALGRALRIG